MRDTNISIINGNIFNTDSKVITIPVNTVGVMEDGLALKARQLFPDLYKYYKHICQARKLKPGMPCLYKRDLLDIMFECDPEDELSKKWILLFPTKKHYKEAAEFSMIREGLEWIVNNYQQEGITSLAVPALGCGLGRLSWSIVGLMLCNYLSQLKVPVEIYLPYTDWE